MASLERAEIELLEEPHRRSRLPRWAVVPTSVAAASLKIPALYSRLHVTTHSLQLFGYIGKMCWPTAQEEVRSPPKRIERGDLDAKQKMVESNLRLVVSIAKNLPQPGPAVLGPDPGGDARAVWCGGEVRLPQRIQVLHRRRPGGCQATARALADKARTIRIPVDIVEKLNQIGRAERKLATGSAASPRPRRSPRSPGSGRRGRSIKRSAQAPVSSRSPSATRKSRSSGSSSPMSGRSHRTSAPCRSSPGKRCARRSGPVLPRAARARAAIRPRRRASAHARRGRAHVHELCASGSAKSKTSRSRSSKKPSVAGSCATTPRPLQALHSAGSGTDPRRPSR